jgi:predicted TIM-barrel fold metal-dependent hydrolase
VLSVENGGHWVPHLLHELASAYGKTPQDFGRDPVEALREHLWVSPFYEDDMERIAAELGLDRLVFGSDWPHAEGLADPTAFAADVPWLDDAGLRTVMRETALGLLTPRPAGARV